MASDDNRAETSAPRTGDQDEQHDAPPELGDPDDQQRKSGGSAIDRMGLSARGLSAQGLGGRLSAQGLGGRLSADSVIVKEARKFEEARAENLRRMGLSDSDGKLKGSIADKIPTHNALTRAVADADRAQSRLAAATRVPQSLVPKTTKAPISAAETYRAAGKAQRRELAQRREDVEKAAEVAERQASYLDVIATAATATKEATLEVHAAIEQMARDAETSQGEALKIARTSKTATVIGVVVSSVSAVIAVVAIVVGVVTAGGAG